MERVKTEEKSEQILLDIRRQIDLYLQGLSVESEEVVTLPKERTLFDQVVQRYQEELDKLKDDPEFKPVYIGIKDMGEEIHVWALIDEHDCYTKNALADTELKVNRSKEGKNYLILTFFYYRQYHTDWTPENGDGYIILLNNDI